MGLFIYLFIIYMYKLIIWLDGYVFSLSGSVPSCPCVGVGVGNSLLG